MYSSSSSSSIATFAPICSTLACMSNTTTNRRRRTQKSTMHTARRMNMLDTLWCTHSTRSPGTICIERNISYKISRRNLCISTNSAGTERNPAAHPAHPTCRARRLCNVAEPFPPLHRSNDRASPLLLFFFCRTSSGSTSDMSPISILGKYAHKSPPPPSVIAVITLPPPPSRRTRFHPK